MHTEDCVVDYYRQSEVVEHVGEVVPDVGVAVFARALGVEAVGLGHAAGLVVATDEVDAVGVAEFEADEEGNCFDAEEAAVYVVACERYTSARAWTWHLLRCRQTHRGISSSCPDTFHLF